MDLSASFSFLLRTKVTKTAADTTTTEAINFMKNISEAVRERDTHTTAIDVAEKGEPNFRSK